MTISNVQPEDIVLCDVRGQEFYGVVVEKDKQELVVRPIIQRIKGETRIVTSRQVKARYKRMKS